MRGLAALGDSCLSAARQINVPFAVGFGCAVAWSPTLVMAANAGSVSSALASLPPHGACMPSLFASAFTCLLVVVGGIRSFALLQRVVKLLWLGVVMALVGGAFLLEFALQRSQASLNACVLAVAGVLVVVLYLFWMKAFGELPVQEMLLTLFFSQIMTCGINAALNSVYTILAASVAFPLVSIACLHAAGRRRKVDADAGSDWPEEQRAMPRPLVAKLAVIVLVWGAIDHLFRGGYDVFVRAEAMDAPVSIAYHAAAFIVVVVAVGFAYVLFAFKDRFRFGYVYRMIFLLGLGSILALPAASSGWVAVAGYACSVVMYQLVFLLVWVISASVFRVRAGDAPRFFGLVYGCWSLGSLAGALLSSQHVLDAGGGSVAVFVASLAVAVGYAIVFTEKDADALVGFVPLKRRAPFKERCAVLARRYQLTPREAEIAMLIAQGRDSAHIEEKLFLSRSTVQTHRMHLYQKLGIHNRQELLDMIEQVDGDGDSSAQKRV